MTILKKLARLEVEAADFGFKWKHQSKSNSKF